MSMHFDAMAARAVADGAISAEEILALRREGWSNGTIEPDEAEAIFLANDAIRDATPEWVDFFVEALCEYALSSGTPRGYVSQTMADTFVARINRDGHVDSMAELELIVRILEKASDVPTSFKDYALTQIAQAVLTGSGPTRRGALAGQGINADEAGLLRRMLFAAGGDRPASVSRAEADMLFRLKDATLGQASAPEWKQLFVQGVANYLLGRAGGSPLAANRAAELESFMNDRSHGIGRVFGGMARVDIARDVMSLAKGSRPGTDWQAEADQAAKLERGESDWLLDRLMGHEVTDEYEAALVAFLSEESGGAAE